MCPAAVAKGTERGAPRQKSAVPQLRGPKQGRGVGRGSSEHLSISFWGFAGKLQGALAHDT